MVKMSKSIERILDVSEEKDKEIIDIFKKISKDGEVFLSLIAPYVGVKISPSKEIMATMGLSEEFGIETVIEIIKACKPKCSTLYLLINSPGGLVQSSYKVARALTKNFENIVVFVPHIAASGGTLAALVGNKIIMGMMSQLTPLDPHTNGISALSVVRGFETVTGHFKKMSEKDAPYTYKVLAKKYDAIQLDTAISSLELMKKYVTEILKGSGYKKDKIEEISTKLVEGFLAHDEVINLDKARDIGLNTEEYTKFPKHWKVFRSWLEKYILQSADKHIIRYWINNKEGGKDEKTKKNK